MKIPFGKLELDKAAEIAHKFFSKSMEVSMRLGMVFSVLCAISLFGENSAEEKIYLSEKQIAVHENQLFVCIDGQWVTTEALFADASGVYIQGRKWYEPWHCGFCGADNPPHYVTCWNCGR